MTTAVGHFLLGLPVWLAVLAVFALPALESSAFVGFVFPGEVALVLGGVLAWQGHTPLAAVLAAGIGGAVAGDSVGYLVGRRWGRRILEGVLGRLVHRDQFDRAEAYLAERGGKAVFVGRFTAALRVLIPGLAGMSGMPYRRFAFFNITGGAAWATMSVLIGYAGGSSWEHASSLAGRIGLGVLAGVAAVLAARWLSHRRRDRQVV